LKNTKKNYQAFANQTTTEFEQFEDMIKENIETTKDDINE